jgi:hypothetical protein
MWEIKSSKNQETAFCSEFLLENKTNSVQKPKTENLIEKQTSKSGEVILYPNGCR